jgi:hypothetical protein
MTDDYDPELRPPARPGGADHGTDYGRDFGDEPAPAYRDAPPDFLGPIDQSSPVSGHVPLAEPTGAAASLAPEQNWEAAAAVVVPVLRPAGTTGLRIGEIDREALVANANKAHTLPLIGDGPCDLAVAYALPATGFDVIVNGEHLLAWNVEPSAVHDAAMANLAAWSAGADWSDESSGDRRLLSSDTGSGLDAARILLPEVRDHLTQELAPSGRVLVGLPERHVLLAGALRPGDDDFAALVRDYVVEHSADADEPIDRRVFELRGADLVEFAG